MGPARTACLESSVVVLLRRPERVDPSGEDPGASRLVPPSVEKPAGLQGEVLEPTVNDMNGVASVPRRVRFSFEDIESGELSQR